MTRLTFITLLSIIILVLASLMHWQGTGTDDTTVRPASRALEPDFYMVNAQATQFDEQGQVKQRMQAQRIAHYTKGDYILADQPNVTLINQEGIPWHIRANKGRGYNNNRFIDLWDQVVLQRNTPANILTLKTEQLTLDTVSELARTDRDVVIIDNASRVEATGMKAYIPDNRIEFLSNVRVTHDPLKPR